MSQSSSPDVATAVAGIRASMAELDVAIANLRDEATRLRANADSAMAIALLDPPDTGAMADRSVETDDSETHDSEPDAVEPGAPAVVAVETDDPALGDRPPAVAVDVPAFGGLADIEAVPSPVDVVDQPNVGGATVLEFPTPVEPADPVTGASIDREPADVAVVPAADEIEAIVESESTDMPDDWDDDDDADEEAFAKFFSDDVEPEPAQRWLLNDL